jgi:hypothetical protein
VVHQLLLELLTNKENEMAFQEFTLATNLTLTNVNVTGNGVFTLWTSQNINNNNNLPGCRLIVDYSNPSPSDIAVTAVLESNRNGMWFPLAYQFNPFNNIDNGPQRIIFLTPTTDSDNSGIDDDVYVGNAVIARISRQQGRCSSSMRVRLILNENNYGNQYAFQSVRVSVYGELFD